MKKRILTLLAAVCLLSAVLSGCGGGSQNGTTGTTDQSTANTQTEGPAARAAAGELNVGIAQDLDSSLDPHKTVKAGTREVMFNVFEGLLKPDASGNLNPAVAESYTVSDDHLLYTFKLRSGATWVDSQGRKVADVTADDFVAGMQHMMDAMGGLEYLVSGIIVNADEYINGVITDFSQVGVTAVDANTVEYKLLAPCPYFVTMLGYGVFAPMSRTYYDSMGGKFGADYDASAESYRYGKDPNSIAYCGPYLVTNATANSTIVFSANDSYWM